MIKIKTENGSIGLGAPYIAGGSGEPGGYYIPSVDADGTLTWQASKEDMPEVAAANVKGADGNPGAPGEPGKDGYTPVKGVDYWTAADKEELVNEVVASLPNGEEAEY